ncbi:GNAT family N-acetyltransferase [Thermomicrobium sp. CFH 73360]|uniref:GNAT family N-acetyltransferase n=1 Tax=Thermomicrobium sp. CFH 73360 TaxID=2951987 RepID=UPI0020770638|nr:GNAT family N-acetyltransferase [Thermomicrobium sp. CFH 73360]MCM8745793.1 GNAT family N-acetyltransferase [Thermomicrobium sp. CFH 73360]
MTSVEPDARLSSELHAVDVEPVRTPEELELVYEIRREVFDQEQHLTTWVRDFPEDEHSLNVLAWIDGQAVGTGRVSLWGDEAQIAWVAVRKPYRGQGVGRAVMHSLLRWAREHGARIVTLNAQTHALGFYQKLGFRPIGRPFYMGHIEHQLMELELRPRQGEGGAE